jgi:hypothetical protein
VLVNGLSQSRIIYLDTNYWVWLRDAERGTGTAEAVRLLKTLRGLVRSRKFICVGQFHSLLELAKHDCAEFIDAKLCLQIRSGLCPWTKVGQIHKHDMSTPILAQATETSKNVVLKAAVDTLWNASLQDVMESFAWDTKTRLNADIDSAVFVQIEKRKRAQLARGLSREQVRVNEFYGVVHDRVRPVVEAQLVKWHAQHGFSAGFEAAVRDVKTVVDAAVAEFNAHTLGRFLPTVALQTELYTLYETAQNRSKPLTSNDNADWNHAANALAHCNMFLTERHLAHQLRQELKADEQYGCVVVGSIAEALCTLTSPGGGTRGRVLNVPGTDRIRQIFFLRNCRRGIRPDGFQVEPKSPTTASATHCGPVSSGSPTAALADEPSFVPAGMSGSSWPSCASRSFKMPSAKPNAHPKLTPDGRSSRLIQASAALAS